jgi:hypothetical protein
MQLGRIEVAEAHFDPCARIIGITDAQTVAIADISHCSAERLAGPAWQLRCAWIGVREAWRQCEKTERDDCGKELHDRSFST